MHKATVQKAGAVVAKLHTLHASTHACAVFVIACPAPLLQVTSPLPMGSSGSISTAANMAAWEQALAPSVAAAAAAAPYSAPATAVLTHDIMPGAESAAYTPGLQQAALEAVAAAAAAAAAFARGKAAAGPTAVLDLSKPDAGQPMGLPQQQEPAEAPQPVHHQQWQQLLDTPLAAAPASTPLPAAAAGVDAVLMQQQEQQQQGEVLQHVQSPQQPVVCAPTDRVPADGRWVPVGGQGLHCWVSNLPAALTVNLQTKHCLQAPWHVGCGS